MVFEAWITVEWSRPPNLSPIAGKDVSVYLRHRYIATCRGYEIIREVPNEQVQLKRLENDWVEMLRRSFHRYTASRTSDDNIQLTLPIDTLAAIGNSNRFAVSDHRRNRLGEQIWVLPCVVRLALPDTGDRFGRILRSRISTGTGLHFSVVLPIVHRRIQDGHGIHHGRQNLDRL